MKSFKKLSPNSNHVIGIVDADFRRALTKSLSSFSTGQKNPGTFPIDKINHLFGMMFAAMDKYRETAPERAPVCRVFWECTKSLFDLHEKNTNWRLDEFPRCLQSVDLVVKHHVLKPETRKVFEELKEIEKGE